MVAPRTETLSALQVIKSSTVEQWQPIEKGYSSNKRWIVYLKNGSSVFVKEAVDEDTTNWLNKEKRVYEAIKADYMPKYYGWSDKGDYPALFLENLSYAEWPPPWNNKKIDEVKNVIELINNTSPPDFIDSLVDDKLRLSGWHEVINDPAGLISLGVVDEKWLDKNLKRLMNAEDDAEWRGNKLLHLDIRSDNLCFAGSQVKVFDWNLAKIGNEAYDYLFWLARLYLEGGPSPWDLTLDNPELISAIAGFFAKNAPKPDPWEGSKIRPFQLRQLKVALVWACRALAIPEPKSLIR